MPPRREPGNPLWVDWVREFKEEAEAKGSKAAGTYHNALQSLIKHTETFRHPEEALCLKGIGPGIVKKLIDKLEKYCEENNEPFPERLGPPKGTGGGKRAPKRTQAQLDAEEEAEEAARAARRDRAMGRPVAAPPLNAYNITQTSPGPPQKKRAPRAYVPRQGSGPYGIFLGLYKHANADDHSVWITKSELIDVASEFCDSSYEDPSMTRNGSLEGGAGRHTAWSSMSSLLSKGLVLTDNKRPKRFALTEEGYELAEKLAHIAGVHLHEPIGAAPADLIHHPDPKYRADPLARRPDVHAPVAGPSGYRDLDPADVAFDDDDDDPLFRQQMLEAMALSKAESQPSSSGASGAGPARALPGKSYTDPRPAGPIGHARPSNPFQESQALFDEPLRQYNTSSSSAAVPSLPRPARPALDGRKAASGLYAAYAPPPSATGPSRDIDKPFEYFYLDFNDKRIVNRDDAEISQDDATGMPIYRIEYPTRQDLHGMARQLLRKEPTKRAVPIPGDSTMTGWIRARASNALAPGFRGREIEKESRAAPPDTDPLTSLMAGYKAPKKVAKDAMYALPPAAEKRSSGGASDVLAAMRDNVAAAAQERANFSARSSALQASNHPRAPTSSDPPVSGSSAAPKAGPSRAPPPGPSAAKPPSLPSLPLAHPAPTSSKVTKPAYVPRPSLTNKQKPLQASYPDSPADVVVNRHPLDPVENHVSSASYSHQPFQPKLYHPGSFKVMLIVDHREVSSKSSKRRTELYDDLVKEGVPTARKGLPLGDMIWVARPVNAYGEPTNEDDIVLDAVVERKRLDDLCESILDGRYLEQKLRMKDSAITQRIYIIEKYASEENYTKWGPQIWTSKSQIQLHDGFYVYESSNVKSTIAWLKLRTRIMAELYENSTLYVIPDALIDRSTYLPLQAHMRKEQPATRYLTTYKMFAELNRADGAATVGTQWAKMVQCVMGMSSEKAVQLVEKWPTPAVFVRDLQAHQAGIEAENREIDAENASGAVPVKDRRKKRKVEDFVVDNLVDAGGTRAIKGALSAKVYAVFGKEQYTRGLY